MADTFEDEEFEIQPITVKEARRRMKQVKTILKKMEPVFAQFEKVARRLIDSSKKKEPQEISKLRYEADLLEEELEGIQEELLELGCYVKDFRSGLVDFISVRGDKPVWLCFQRGEKDLRYYHGWNDGYVGRKLIDFE